MPASRLPDHLACSSSKVANGTSGDKDVAVTFNGYSVIQDVPVVENVLLGYSYGRQTDKRWVTGWYAGSNLWKFTGLVEFDLIDDRSVASENKRDQYAAYSELNFLLFDWLNVKAAVDYADDDGQLTRTVNGQQAIATMPPNTYKQVLDTYKAAHPGQPAPFVSAPFPKGSVTRTSMFGGRMLVINAGSKHPQEAWKLVRYLATEPIFTEYYTTQFPAQRSLLKNVNWSPELKGFADQLTLARTWGPYSDGPASIGSLWNATGRAFSAALSGQRSEQEAAQDLMQAVTKLMQSRPQ